MHQLHFTFDTNRPKAKLCRCVTVNINYCIALTINRYKHSEMVRPTPRFFDMISNQSLIDNDDDGPGYNSNDTQYYAAFECLRRHQQST